MRTLKMFVLSVSLLVSFAACPARATAAPNYTRTKDVIYGRKFGLAMTLDVFTPKEKANGAAVIVVVSGGWFSSHDNVAGAAEFYGGELLKRGYTVFAVVHGSQPKFTLPEIVEDMHRAVRFIRYNAKEYKIDPDRIGITGGSAGGHLSLMMGTAGCDGDPKAKDPIDRGSSRVQAVACFFPPTDFLNYGKAGREFIDRDFRPPFTAAVDYHEFDPKKAMYIRVTDKDKLREISRKVSPIAFVSKDSARTLLIHGDKDTLVPLQQSEEMVEKLKEAKVPVELIVKKGAGHGWLTMGEDVKSCGEWFDVYLLKKKKQGDK